MSVFDAPRHGYRHDRYDPSIKDVQAARNVLKRQFPGSDVLTDNYLTETHSNEICNNNRFYYGAVLEMPNDRYVAVVKYGRIGQNQFEGKFKEQGTFSSFESAYNALERQLNKKRKGKKCSKCGERTNYSDTTLRSAEENQLTPEIFGKLVGQYPQPPNNPLPVGGFMDEGFEWTVNQAENEEFGASSIFEDHHNTYRLEFKRNTSRGWELLRVWKNEQDAINNYYDIYLDYPEVRLLEVDEDGDSEQIMSQRNLGYQKEEFGSSNKKLNWLNGLIGLGVLLVGYDFLTKKVLKSDTIIENPDTGSLKPADYEELVVQSTGYYVPIIPVGLDPAFMGSRFHALPTDRLVYDDPNGIGAHIDVAMSPNTNFLPNEQSLVMASEAPGQSPYNSMQPNGQENPDFPLRVIHETTTVSLDGSVAKFIPQDLSGYTGQQFIPTSVYEDMLGIGISGQTPAFTVPESSGIGSNRFGSRIANPDSMLTNVVGVLNENVNGDYTDGSMTMSLSEWSMQNQVQQISDTEAIVIERGSGSRKMIRRV